MHDPLFVTANQGVVSLNRAHFLDADKLGVEIKIFVLGFLFLHLHDFVYRVSNIKNFVVLPELTDFDLRVVQQILDYEIHKLSRVLLSFFRVIQVIDNVLAILKILSFLKVRWERIQKTFELLVQS